MATKGNLTAKQKNLFNSLKTSLRKQVALEYIKLGYDNGTKSYLNACKKLNKIPSKNPVTSASEILNYPNVIKFIDSVREKVADSVQLNAEWVLRNLEKVALRCMSAEPVLIRGSDGMEESGEYKFDSAGANRSLELIGKHLKLFTDKIDHSSNDGSMSPDGLSKEERQSRIQTLLSKSK